jgi:nucleoside-diphosphate-sugar epimerase
LNFLFLGFGPIASNFLKEHVAPSLDNKALIVSNHTSGIMANGATLINKPLDESFEDIDVVINSWKSLDSLNRGWEIESLVSLARIPNSKIIFVNLSSVAVYGECKKPANEDVGLNPINDYGIKKLEFENFLKVIEMPNLLNLRISNVFGDSQFDDLINRIYNAITKGRSIKLFEPDKIFRDFIHIDRVAKHMQELLLRSDFRSGQYQIDMNVSSGYSLNLSEVIQLSESSLQRKLDFYTALIEPGIILESRINNEKLLNLNGHEHIAVKDLIKAYLAQLDHLKFE